MIHKTIARILTAAILLGLLMLPAAATPVNFAAFWTDPALADPNARYDMTSGSLACRFATQGEAAIKGLSFYTASWDIGTFDLKVYEWKYNYEYTVAQQPAVSMNDISGIASGWLDIVFPNELPHGEYLAVVDGFDGKLMCNYRFTDNQYTDVYLNGEKQDCSLQWAVEFTRAEGGSYVDAPLSAEVAAEGENPPTSDPVIGCSILLALSLATGVAAGMKRKKH